MNKVYEITLHSRQGKKIYVESISRKIAVQAADKLVWVSQKQDEWEQSKWYRPFLRLIFGRPRFDYPGDKNG